MKCTVQLLCVLATVALLIPGAVCDRTDEEELILRRNRRTVQFLVNHFVHFFGLSGGGGGTKKIEPKQDNVFSLPLTNILKASAGKFSAGSGQKRKPVTPEREPTLQHDLPTWIDDRPQKVGANPYSEAFEADSLEPTRVSLLSTTREPEETTTISTTTTTTEEIPTTTTTEAVPIEPTEATESEASEAPATELEAEEPATSAPTSDEPSQEGASSTEESPIDPDAVNRLSDQSLSSRNDARDESFQPTPVPLVSYQHYIQPAVWPPTAGFQHAFPMQQYFGNNVFFPAQNTFPLASPFQVQAVPTHSQGYPSNQPVYDNRLYYPSGPESQAKSHSRVKLHDNHYDLVTYHDDTEPAASNYQMQSFGNYRTQRY
uniref:Uncharacterized protein n=1 Tax=Anopheles culicifacies TaxID=139723 RepID=A0A182MSV4_9DIPT